MPLHNPNSGIRTFNLLDQIVTVLDPGSNNVFFWPFLEPNGNTVQTYGAGIDEQLDVTIDGTTAGLNAVIGFAPHQHPGLIHSYSFEASESPALVGDDVATASFVSGSNDTAFTIGAFFRRQTSGTITLMSKYDVAGTLREYKLDVESNDLKLLLYDESANAEEGVRTTTALNVGQWYFGAVTYGGAGGNGSGQAADDMIVYIDGSAVSDTDIDDASYVDMEDTNAPLMIGATDDKAAPASEWDGGVALPFMVNTQLTATNIATFNGLGVALLGL